MTTKVELPIQIGDTKSIQEFLVTDLGQHQAILGHTWLEQHNPRIDWQQREIELSDIEIQALAHGNKATELAYAQDKKDERPLEEKVPKYLHHLMKVFQEEEKGEFPPSRPYDHKIILKDDFEPSISKVFPMTAEEEKLMDESIDEWLERGLITPSESPQAVGAFFIKKKDGKGRFCQNYPVVNNATVKDGYPLPRIGEIMDIAKDWKYFTVLDVKSGYNNIRIREGDEWKAAFITKRGIFEPKVMFFGLCNSPATFQRFMDDIYGRMLRERRAACYMDDVLTGGRTREECRRNTIEAVSILEQNHLHAKVKKCQFEEEKVSYLGMILTPGHIEMDPIKVAGIADWPTPTKVKDVQSFLGFANFYRKFIAGYAEIAKPLDNLKRKDQKWEWTKECDQAFNTLKQRFLSKPILQIPDKSKPFVLETDASKYASGAILLQEDSNGDLKPCGYISKGFNPAEQRYQIYDRELLAIIRALKTWRHYLEGPEITIRCDHKNLTYFKNPQFLTDRQARWQLYLSRFNYKLDYVPGKKLIQADVLSRRPDFMQNEEKIPETLLTQEVFVSPTEVSVENEDIRQRIQRLNETDDLVVQAVTAIQNGSVPPLKTALSDWKHHEGLLFYKGRLYVPDNLELRRDIVSQHHDLGSAGHPGQYGTRAAVARTYWWPSLGVFIRNYVMGCAQCQQNKVNTHPTLPPLMPIKADKDALPFSMVTMDFITDLPESHGYTALYVVVDHNLSKGIVLVPCTKTETAMSTAKLYHENVYRRFGLPRTMISDRGPQFASQVIQELYKRLGVNSRLSTAYHPQTDGQTERMNREIEVYLRIYCGAHPETWYEHLSDLEFSHNQRANANSGKTPFELIMGYNPTPIPSFTLTSKYPALEDRLRELRDIRQEALAAHEMARVRMAERITRSFVPFKKGDKVWLEAKNLKVGGAYRKLKVMREGPFEIEEVMGPLTYRLKLPRGWTIHPVFHAALLSPFRTTAVHGPAYAEPPPDVIDGENEWEPEAILRHRKRGRSMQYLVKWKEYPTSENSWETEDNLSNAEDLLNAYKRRLDLAAIQQQQQQNGNDNDSSLPHPHTRPHHWYNSYGQHLMAMARLRLAASTIQSMG